MAKNKTVPKSSPGVEAKKRGQKATTGRTKGRIVVVMSDDFESWLNGLKVVARESEVSDLVRKALVAYSLSLGYTLPPTKF